MYGVVFSRVRCIWVGESLDSLATYHGGITPFVQESLESIHSLS